MLRSITTLSTRFGIVKGSSALTIATPLSAPIVAMFSVAHWETMPVVGLTLCSALSEEPQGILRTSDLQLLSETGRYRLQADCGRLRVVYEYLITSQGLFLNKRPSLPYRK